MIHWVSLCALAGVVMAVIAYLMGRTINPARGRHHITFA
jgi:hypothetical protein